MPGSRLVDPAFKDAFGERQHIAPDVRDAVRAAMGLRPSDSDPAGPAIVVAHRGERLPRDSELVLEDGTQLGRVPRLPPDAPFGYHRLRRGSLDQLLILGPGRCHLPRDLREWGWAIQLATMRSGLSWGIGDLRDLRKLASWSAGAGARFMAIGPLNAPNPGPEPEPSPYFPSSRRFLSPLHLCVEEVPGADAVSRLSAAGRALNADRLVDRRRVLALKMRALERIWSGDRIDREGLAAYRRARGGALERWATFVVLTERLGPDWRSWPAKYRDPDGAAVASVAAAASDRIGFHAWLQWLLDRQLSEASVPLRRIADMPVGIDPGGFDAWDWQAQLAIGATIGVPPDRFSTSGQNWGLPPFIPHRLRESEYRPFVETLRAQLRHAGGLHMDHVLGLFRLWWIPAGFGPDGGAYVRNPTDELLEIVALESERAGAVVVGEDLGTVPSGVRRELRRRRLLSTRLVFFEGVPPDRYPRQAFAAVTTHDLPTIAGTLSGFDARDQRRAGVTADKRGLAQMRRRLLRASGLSYDAPLRAMTEAIHRRLAASPSMLVSARLEDALQVRRRPNLPGTVSTQRPNWSVALPLPLESLMRSPRVHSLVEALRRGRPRRAAGSGRRAGAG